MIFKSNAQSNLVGLFHQFSTLTLLQEFEENKFKTLYLVLPPVALICLQNFTLTQGQPGLIWTYQFSGFAISLTVGLINFSQ
jgi:hypothetical protein